MGTYQVNVNVSTPGRERLDSLRDIIQRTSQQANISTRDFQTWSSAMGLAVDSGYSFDNALQKVQATLKKASVDVGAFTSALRENAREQKKVLEEAEQAVSRYQRVAAGVGGRILGNISGIPGGGFIGSGIAQSLGLSGGAAIGLGAGGAAILGVYEITKQVNEVAKYAQAQRNLAAEMGTTVQTTQLLGRVSEVTGVNVNGITSAFERLSRTVADGGQESHKAARALEELGLSSAEAFKAPETQLQDVLAALRRIPDEGERARLVVNLLGDSGKQLLPLVDNFQRISQAVKDTGVLIDDQGIAKLNKLRESTEILALEWQNVKNQIAGAVVAIIEFYNSGSRTKGGPNAPPPLPGFMFPGGRSPDFPVTDAAGKAGSGTQSGIDLERDIQYRGRQAISKQILETGMSPVERLRSELKDLQDDEKTANERFITGRGDSDSLRKAAAAVRAKEQQIEALRKKAAPDDASTKLIERQYESLERLANEDLSPEESLRMLSSLNKKDFTLVRNTPLYKELRQRLSTQGLTAISDEADIRLREPSLGRGPREAEQIMRDWYRDPAGDEAAARALREGTRGVAAGLGTAESYTGLENVVSQGDITALKYKLPPDAYARLQLGRTVSEAGKSFGYKAEAAGDEAAFYRTAQQANPIGARASDYLEQARDKELEQTKFLVEGQIKQVEEINKFNEALGETGNKIRTEIADGLSSLVLGAQSGGGRGASSAIRGFAVKQESAILDNVFKLALEHAGIGRPGSGPDPNSGLGRILQGTVFGGVGKKESLPGIDSNTQATINNTTATWALKQSMDVARGSTAVGGGVYSGSGAIPGALPDGLPISSGSIYRNPLGISAGSVAGDVSTLANIGAQVAGATATGSPIAILGSVGGALSKIGSVIGDTAQLAIHVPGGLAGAAVGSIQGTVGLSGTQKVGLVGAGIASAVGVTSGIMTAAHGGAKSVLGGTAEALGAAAIFAGPAAPIVAAVAAVAGLVAAVLPDPRVQRELQIQKTLFTQQYLAPPSINMNAAGNAGFSDTDMFGHIRTSNLSPYPSIRDPYLDVPRRTVVPGGTVSQFGNQNITGARGSLGQPGTTIHVHVSTMDAKSFQDNSHQIIDAIHLGLNRGQGTAMVPTLASHLGIR